MLPRTASDTSFGWVIARHGGSEGPRHDPYSYQEWVLTRVPDGARIIIHEGFTSWMEWRNLPHPHRMPSAWSGRVGDACDFQAAFNQILNGGGFDLRLLEKIWMRAHYRCPQCGGLTSEASGYPGETLNVCERCGKIVSTDFNEAAVV